MNQFFIAVCVVVVFSGCESSSETSMGNGSTQFGTMVGFLTYIDTMTSDYYNSIRRPLAGATVRIEGLSLTAQSDVNGKWEIRNVPAGTYKISALKEGYSTSVDPAFPFVGNGTDMVSLLSAAKIPYQTPASLVVRSFEPYSVGVLRDTFYLGFNGDTIPTYIVDSIEAKGKKATFSATLKEKYCPYIESVMNIFFGADSNIVPSDPSTFKFALSGVTGSFENRFNFVFTTDTLVKSGFQSGQEIYCAAYATNEYGKYCYFIDMKTGRLAYTGYGPLRAVNKFVLP
jgi:hypothetical protein